MKKEIALELGHPEHLLSVEPMSTEIKAEILSNYAKANIYIRTLDVQSIVESAKYTVRMDADKAHQS